MITGVAPQIQSAVLSADGDQLTLTFDANIATTATCSQILSDSKKLGFSKCTHAFIRYD